MTVPQYEPAPRSEPIYDPVVQRKLRDLQKAAHAVTRHETAARLARDQRGGQMYVLLAEGSVSQAKLANVCMMTRQGVAHVARKWAKENDWPWPPRLPPPTAGQRAK